MVIYFKINDRVYINNPSEGVVVNFIDKKFLDVTGSGFLESIGEDNEFYPLVQRILHTKKEYEMRNSFINDINNLISESNFSEGDNDNLLLNDSNFLKGLDSFPLESVGNIFKVDENEVCYNYETEVKLYKVINSDYWSEELDNLDSNDTADDIIRIKMKNGLVTKPSYDLENMKLLNSFSNKFFSSMLELSNMFVNGSDLCLPVGVSHCILEDDGEILTNMISYSIRFEDLDELNFLNYHMLSVITFADFYDLINIREGFFS